VKIKLLAAAVAALALAAPATAHRFPPPRPVSTMTLPQRAAYQRAVIRHDRRVLETVPAVSRVVVPFLATTVTVRLGDTLRVRRFHAAQLRWTRRELRQTEHAIAAAARAPTSTGHGPWLSATATWYGPCCYGNGPSCKGYPPLTQSSWYVASMTLACGTMVTICDRGCARAPVADTGAFAAGNFDLAPAVARAIGGLYTHRVRWRLG
jgi:hypothetical protein